MAGKRITKKTLLRDAMAIHPETIAVFLKYGLHCIGCHAATFESIEAGARAHGLQTEQIDEMITELNVLLENEKPVERKIKKDETKQTPRK